MSRVLIPDAEQANEIAASALVVSWFALAASVLAALFAGWQALTAHLERTRKLPARWLLDFPIERGARWVIHNTGGSTATDVSVSLRWDSSTGFVLVDPLRATSAIPPHGSAEIEQTGSMTRPGPNLKRVGVDGWHLPNGEDGTPAPAPLHPIATVTWRDYRGRERAEPYRLFDSEPKSDPISLKNWPKP